MPVYVDQLHRQVNIPPLPQRIVSLVPSQTELLFDLGGGDRVAGITKFCVHPQQALHTKTIVGGTKKINHHILKELQPDLIIANKEENTQADIEVLAQDYPVWVSDVNNLPQAQSMIASIGEIIGNPVQALMLNTEIEKSIAKLKQTAVALAPIKNVAYFIWYKPWMVAASDTYINSMLKLCGWQNVFETQKRYPIVEIDELAKLNPDIILLSSEPFPFSTMHVQILQTVCPASKIILTDGEMWSWYGSRLRHSLPAIDFFLKTLA